jgi:hypothetical protein
LSELNFYFNQPIPPDAEWREAKEIFGEILAGRVPSLGLYRENRFSRLQNSDLHIVKFNFGHFLIGWMFKNFDFKAIAMIRHPCAVIASQLSSKGFRNLEIPEQWDWPSFKYNEYYKQYGQFYKNVNTREEMLAFLWALQTKEVVSAAKMFNLNTVFYENLVINYDSEVSRLIKSLGLNVDFERLKKQQYHPSKSTFSGREEKILRQEQLNEWQSKMSHKSQDRIIGIVKEIGIDLYNMNIMPSNEIV